MSGRYRAFLSRPVVRGGCQRDYAEYVRKILPMTVVMLRSTGDKKESYAITQAIINQRWTFWA